MFWGIYYILWISVFCGFYFNSQSVFTGIIGFEVADFIIDYSGKIGLILTLTFTGLIIIVIHWKIFPEFLKFSISKKEAERENKISDEEDSTETEFKKRDLIVKEKSNDDLKKELNLEINKIADEKFVEEWIIYSKKKLNEYNLENNSEAYKYILNFWETREKLICKYGF